MSEYCSPDGLLSEKTRKSDFNNGSGRFEVWNARLGTKNYSPQRCQALIWCLECPYTSLSTTPMSCEHFSENFSHSTWETKLHEANNTTRLTSQKDTCLDKVRIISLHLNLSLNGSHCTKVRNIIDPAFPRQVGDLRPSRQSSLSARLGEVAPRLNWTSHWVANKLASYRWLWLHAGHESVRKMHSSWAAASFQPKRLPIHVGIQIESTRMRYISIGSGGYKHWLSRGNKPRLGGWSSLSGRGRTHAITPVATSLCHAHTVVFGCILVEKNVLCLVLCLLPIQGLILDDISPLTDRGTQVV